MRFSSAPVKIHQIPHVNFELTSHSSLNFASYFIVMTHNSPVNFKPYIFYFGKKDPIKVSILRLSSALGKICQIPYVIFQTTSQFLRHSSVSWKITCLYFFSSNIYFGQKDLIKVQIFETSECSGQNLSNSLCQSWNDKSIPLQIFHHSSVSSQITIL